MEILKLYDINHNYVESKDRAYIHSHLDKLYHDCVHIIVISNQNKILLQKRSPFKNQHPNLWDLSVTGHVTACDSLKVACKREMLEEIGIDAIIDDFEELLVIRDDKNMEFLHLFLLSKRLDEKTNFIFEDKEVSEVKFFDLKDFNKMFYSQEFSPYFEEYKKEVSKFVNEILK